MNRIENKVAIVTGGTQGLGAAIAWQFAQAGAKAILTCGRNAENGSQVATKITQSTGVPVVFVQHQSMKGHCFCYFFNFFDHVTLRCQIKE